MWDEVEGRKHWNAIGSIACVQSLPLSLLHFFVSGHTNIIWQMSALIYLFIWLSQLTRVNRNDMPEKLCAACFSSIRTNFFLIFKTSRGNIYVLFLFVICVFLIQKIYVNQKEFLRMDGIVFWPNCTNWVELDGWYEGCTFDVKEASLNSYTNFSSICLKLLGFEVRSINFVEFQHFIDFEIWVTVHRLSGSILRNRFGLRIVVCICHFNWCHFHQKTYAFSQPDLEPLK